MMSYRRKSTLFLLEQLVVIAVFALCAATCISILTTSFFMARDSKDTADALIAAQNCAEAFKAAGNVPVAGSDDPFHGLVVYYDKDWQGIGSADGAEFVLALSVDVHRSYDNAFLLYYGEVSVDKISGENLVKLPVAAKRLITES